MATLNVAGIIAGASKALEAINELSPLAKSLGIVSPIATIGISAVSIITHTLERAAAAKVAMSTQDEAKLKAMLEELGRANDKLNAAIADS